MAERPETLRRTFLERSSRCLRLAHLEHEAGVSGPEARVGNAFHSIGAAVGFACVAAGLDRPTEPMVRAITDRVLGSAAYVDFTRAMYDDVVDLVDRWWRHARFFPDERFEQKYRTELAGETLTGTIDRLRIVGDRAFVEDYKTGRGTPAEPPTIQGDVYSWHIFMHEPDVQEVEYRERWVRFGIPTDPHVYRREAVMEPVERWLRSRIAAINEAYEAPRLPTRPGGWCANCPGSMSCPHPEWVRAESQITGPEDAQERLGALLVLEARVKHTKKVLRAYVEASGERAIAVNGEEFGWATAPGSSLDSKAAAVAGVDLDALRKRTPPSFGRRKETA